MRNSRMCFVITGRVPRTISRVVAQKCGRPLYASIISVHPCHDSLANGSVQLSPATHKIKVQDLPASRCQFLS